MFYFRGLIFIFIFIFSLSVYADKDDLFQLVVKNVSENFEDDTDLNTFSFKIIPAFNSVKNALDNNLCKNLVAIVPIQMMEAWMLADKELLKREIGTQKADIELGLHRLPESIADPKDTIKEAIRIGRQDMTKRRRNDLTINDLYQIIGSSINIHCLHNLSSYKKFREAVQAAFRELNYLN